MSLLSPKELKYGVQIRCYHLQKKVCTSSNMLMRNSSKVHKYCEIKYYSESNDTFVMILL